MFQKVWFFFACSVSICWRCCGEKSPLWKSRSPLCSSLWPAKIRSLWAEFLTRREDTWENNSEHHMSWSVIKKNPEHRSTKKHKNPTWVYFGLDSFLNYTSGVNWEGWGLGIQKNKISGDIAAFLVTKIVLNTSSQEHFVIWCHVSMNK